MQRIYCTVANFWKKIICNFKTLFFGIHVKFKVLKIQIKLNLYMGLFWIYWDHLEFIRIIVYLNNFHQMNMCSSMYLLSFGKEYDKILPIDYLKNLKIVYCALWKFGILKSSESRASSAARKSQNFCVLNWPNQMMHHRLWVA